MTAAVDVQIEERTKPFLKWAGGKSRLLPELLKRLPEGAADLDYFEPFCGGAALFFALRPARARLGDANELLIDTLRAVRDELPDVLFELEALAEAHSKETFLKTRELLTNPDLARPARAAAFIYLNKTCFNGLYRVNKSGGFNVPFGNYARPNIRNAGALANASEALKRAQLEAWDFERLLSEAKAGSFVYCDPPYVPTSDTANFTSYTSAGFDDHTQVRLSEAFRKAAERGALLMMSQSDHRFVRSLYKGFIIQKVWNSRSVSANGDMRGQVSELIIRNYR